MTLDLGELAAFLVVDDKRWNFDGALHSLDRFGARAKADAKTAGDQAGQAFGDSLVPEAERAGEEAGEEAGDGFITKAKLGAAAAGTMFGLAFNEALDLGASQDKLVAQLGANARQSERYGHVATRLYRNAWGESMDEVNTAVGSVVTSIDGLDNASGRQLGRLTSRALDFATAFEVDVARSVQVADTLIEAKLAKNGIRALDLLTRGAQRVPSALREDLMDAVEEYGQFFHTLGYDGKQAFALLVDASEKGIYGIDKAGDAVKEFTIRATDGSKASKDAYALIGLSAEDMSNQILKGGDTAQQATQRIIQGLLDLEDPSQRAQAAIALFGTPLEDLNVGEIPEFLRNLQGASDTMDGFRGSSKKMSDDLNGNARTSITEFTRTLKMDLVGYLEDKVIPVVEDDVIPAVRRFSRWFENDGGPALRDFKDDVDPAIDAVRDLAGFLNDLPGEAKLGGVIALLGGLGALKVRGGGGKGILGTAGQALGLAKPVPVFVTNPGFGGPGGPGGPGGGMGGGMGKIVVGSVASLAVAAAATVGIETLSEKLAPETTEDGNWGTPGSIVKPSTNDTDKGGIIDMTGFFGVDDKDGAKADVDELTRKVNGFQDALDLAGSTKVHPDLAVPGLKQAAQGLSDFIDMQIDAGKPVHAAIFLTGVERAMQQISTLNAGIDALGERGLDNGVPYVHGGGPRGDGGGGRGSGNGRRSLFDGAQFNVQPHNYRDFMQDLQQRSQAAGLGAVGSG